MKTGDMGVYSIPEYRCDTPNGSGVAVHCEVAYNSRRMFYRIGVVLDNNPFSYPVAYYPPEQVKEVV